MNVKRCFFFFFCLKNHGCWFLRLRIVVISESLQINCIWLRWLRCRWRWLRLGSLRETKKKLKFKNTIKLFTTSLTSRKFSNCILSAITSSKALRNCFVGRQRFVKCSICSRSKCSCSHKNRNLSDVLSRFMFEFFFSPRGVADKNLPIKYCLTTINSVIEIVLNNWKKTNGKKQICFSTTKWFKLL